MGQQQRVELLKALYRNAELLILDEPTAVLTPQEVEEFFTILRGMREQGKTIVIITHKLGEVLAISDDVTVMRDGKVVGCVKTKETSAAELARLMVGREVLLRVEKPPAKPGDVTLGVRNLSVRSGSGLVLDGVTFDVRAGEIVGIAGVDGNGQRELIEAIAGLVDPALVSGEMTLEGVPLAALDARKRRERGIAHIPEDRHRRGLLLEFGLDENAILGVHYRPPVASGAMLNDREVRRRTADIIQRFDVRPPNPTLPARALSGGNQQKLIIGREFELKPRLLLVAQPTRGVDIGAIEFIHRKLVALRDAGCAVLLVSAELEEVSVSLRSTAGDPRRPHRRRSRSRVGEPGRYRFVDDRRMKTLLFPLIAVIAAFLVGGAFVLAIGDNPIETYRLLIGSALWWPDGIGYTLFLATPLIFTGLAVSVAFRAGLLNIGAEGQLCIAAFATAWVGIVLGSLPAMVLVPLCFAAAVSAGAAWGAIPGLLKARFGSHEVINTIMMNFIAVALASYFTQYHYRTPGDPILQTAAISASAHLPRLGQIIPGLPARIPLNVSFLIALAASALVYVFLWRTKWGYELRATGSNPSAAEYGGISVRRQIVLGHGDLGRSGGHGGHQRGARLSPSGTTTGSPTATGSPASPWRCSDAIIRRVSSSPHFCSPSSRAAASPSMRSPNMSRRTSCRYLQATIILFVAAEAFFREPIERWLTSLRSR